MFFLKKMAGNIIDISEFGFNPGGEGEGRGYGTGGSKYLDQYESFETFTS